MSDNQPLHLKVKDWLEKTGLPLELETAASFKKAGFSVEHSSVYADPQSEKSREIDVIAHTRDRTGMVQFYGAIECKSSGNPWIVLVDGDSSAVVTYSSLGVMSESARESLTYENILGLGSNVGHLLKTMHSNGYALRQAFCKDNDPAYAASMSAMNAAIALATRSDFRTPRYCFAVPVIVVNAPIFECHLDQKGELQFREVHWSEFMFTAYLPERTNAVVRVVSAKALPAFSSVLWRLADAIKVALKPIATEFLKSHMERLRESQEDRNS